MREMIPKLSGETYYSRKTDQNIQHEVLENGLKVPEEGPQQPICSWCHVYFGILKNFSIVKDRTRAWFSASGSLWEVG
jgi:hypothetical protein